MDQIQYRHFMFSWERRWADSGARRLQAKGDPRRFLDQGRESYGYLVCACLWGLAGVVVAIFIFVPTLIASKGTNITAGVELAVIYLLAFMSFIRARQSKKTRIQSPA